MRTCARRRLVGPVGTVVLAVAVLVQPHASAGRLAHELGYATAQRQPDGADQQRGRQPTHHRGGTGHHVGGRQCSVVALPTPAVAVTAADAAADAADAVNRTPANKRDRDQV